MAASPSEPVAQPRAQPEFWAVYQREEGVFEMDALPRPPSTARSLEHCSTVVVKIGSALLARGGRQVFGRFARQIARLRAHNRRVVIVSSAAIAMGLDVLGYAQRPKYISQLQAAAASGQIELMRRWGNALARHRIGVAQVLLSHADLASRERFLNARHALAELLSRDLVPIINENDSVATEEIRVGDNDTLSAQVAGLVGGDLLLLLTTAPGLYTADPQSAPHAERIPLVREPNAVAGLAADAQAHGLGVGGMRTKVRAAAAAAKRGMPVVIAHGLTPNVLQRVLANEDLGTLFLPTAPLRSRKHWIAYTLKPAGAVHVDFGAARALRERGSSLLPTGIVDVRGDFSRGAMVDIIYAEQSVARGLVSYGAAELRRIAGRQSRDIVSILGYADSPEVIHRDDMVLLEAPRAHSNW